MRKEYQGETRYKIEQSLTCKWAHQGSNLGPTDYESAALPLSYGPKDKKITGNLCYFYLIL